MTQASSPHIRRQLLAGAALLALAAPWSQAQADLSGKGLKQSAGLMVNYLYDLGRVETCHERFLRGRVVHSRALSALL